MNELLKVPGMKEEQKNRKKDKKTRKPIQNNKFLGDKHNDLLKSG